ncbi:MAG: tetratricopeptide repeat protein [Candidatus Gastranaerophilales bacterium]|nr:tetratricopeptide repeat protein [Candidatus Gastranaerophilales bacterium]
MNDDIIREYYLIIKNKISSMNFNSAIASADKLLAYAPSDSQGYYYKGVCNFALEKLEEAEDAYKKALLLNSIHAKAYFNLGVVYYMMNDYDNALINIGKSLIVFSKQRELDSKKRCIEALNFIQTERKTFN